MTQAQASGSPLQDDDDGAVEDDSAGVVTVFANRLVRRPAFVIAGARPSAPLPRN